MNVKIINTNSALGQVPIVWDPFRAAFVLVHPNEEFMIECKMRPEASQMGLANTMNLDLFIHGTLGALSAIRSVGRMNIHARSYSRNADYATFQDDMDLWIAETFILFWHDFKEFLQLNELSESS